MGNNADGQISFGLLIDEDFTLPWDSSTWEDEGIDHWWRDINGFVDKHTPFNKEGNYAEGWSQDDPRFKEHYDRRTEWLVDHPLPVDVINYCNGDQPMYLLAVPGVGKRCSWGDPELFTLQELCASIIPEKVDALIAFVKKYEIDTIYGKPQWFLTSYWG